MQQQVYNPYGSNPQPPMYAQQGPPIQQPMMQQQPIMQAHGATPHPYAIASMTPAVYIPIQPMPKLQFDDFVATREINPTQADDLYGVLSTSRVVLLLDDSVR